MTAAWLAAPPGCGAGRSGRGAIATIHGPDGRQFGYKLA